MPSAEKAFSPALRLDVAHFVGLDTDEPHLLCPLCLEQNRQHPLEAHDALYVCSQCGLIADVQVWLGHFEQAAFAFYEELQILREVVRAGPSDG